MSSDDSSAYERVPPGRRCRARGDVQSRAESTAFQAVVVQQVDARGSLITRGATLDGFVAAATAGAGVLVNHLHPLAALFVDTGNTPYHIIVTAGDEVVVQGGTYCPDPTPAHLDGASLGRSLVRVGWIGIGLRMELRAGGQRIVTAPVRAIAQAGGDVVSRPH